MNEKPYEYEGIPLGYRPGRFLEVLHKMKVATANEIADKMGIGKGGQSLACTISVINYKCKECGVTPPFKKRFVGGLNNSPEYVYSGDKTPTRTLSEEEYVYSREKQDHFAPREANGDPDHNNSTPKQNRVDSASKQDHKPKPQTGNRPAWSRRPSGNPGRKHHIWTNDDDARLIQVEESLNHNVFDTNVDFWIAAAKIMLDKFKIDVTPAASCSRHKRLMQTRVLPRPVAPKATPKATQVVNFDVTKEAKKLDSRDPIDKLLKLSDRVDSMRSELKLLSAQVGKLLDMWS